MSGDSRVNLLMKLGIMLMHVDYVEDAPLCSVIVWSRGSAEDPY